MISCWASGFLHHDSTIKLVTPPRSWRHHLQHLSYLLTVAAPSCSIILCNISVTFYNQSIDKKYPKMVEVIAQYILIVVWTWLPCLLEKHFSPLFWDTSVTRLFHALTSADTHRLHHVSGLAWVDEHTLVTASHDASIKQWTITYWAASRQTSTSPGTRTTVDFNLSSSFFNCIFTV